MARGKHEAPKKTKSAPKKAKKQPAAEKKSTAKKRSDGKGKKNVLLAVILIIIFLAIAAVVGAMVVGKTAKIHPNLTLGGVNIGDMTVAEAAEALDDAGWEPDSDASVTAKLPGEYSITVSAAEAGLDLDSEEAAQAAYNYGHSGNPVDDVKAYFKCITGRATQADVLCCADTEGIKTKVSDALKEYSAFLKQGYREDLENERLVMVKGGENIKLDEDELCTAIITAFYEDKESFEYAVSVSSAESVDFDSLHKKLYTEMVEATYDAETQKATESSVGVDFDVSQAQSLWDKAQPGETVIIPLEVTNPKYSTEQLNKMLFRDKLGAQTTTYSSSTDGRATNVELSADKINGTVLNPGEEFSYNDVVGKRTAEAGFKTAAAYAGGKVVQEIGGGICQTSSTLYCAALFANLEITQRDCHMFAVGYVPWGLDATVSWGGPEFKFKNNRDYPIKIVTSYENRELTVEIWGTDVDGSYVEMTNSVSTVYDDEYTSVAVGTKAITYRNVYDKDGNLLSRTQEDVSYYNYHDEDINWPTPSPTQTAKPAQTAKPTQSAAA